MRKPQSGGALILFLIVLPVLLIVIAVVADYGYLVVTKGEAQAATDAAALSAVASIPHYVETGDRLAGQKLAALFNGPSNNEDTDFSINAVMKQSPQVLAADFNYINRDGIVEQIEPPYQNANGVLIRKTYEVPSFFAKILGRESRTIEVQSRALMAGPACMPVDFPIVFLSPSCGDKEPVVDNCNAERCNMEHTLYVSGPDWNDNGGFWTKEGNPSNAEHCVGVVKGTIAPDYVCVGSRIEINNGVVNDCMREIWYQCGQRKCDEGIPWKVTVPIVHCSDLHDVNGGKFNQAAPVRGFARISIVGVKYRGGLGGGQVNGDKWIKFKKHCGDVVNGPSPGGQFCGTYTNPQLVE